MLPSAQFAALADPTRCRLVELLAERPRPVHELAALFSISRPAISRHLRVLKDAELIEEEKQGRENVYSLRRRPLRPLADWLNRHWNLRSVTPKDHAEDVPAAPQMEFDL
jgi:DNA-binding transcriptional ArsR family regulator